MRWATEAAGSDRSLVRVGFEPSDQLLQVGCREIFLGDDQHRFDWKPCNRLEIVQEIVLRGVDGGACNVRAPVADPDRVSVRAGPNHAADADASAGAGHVFDDDGLAERSAHTLADASCDRIHRTARGEWHDDCNRTSWIGLRRSAVGRRRKKKQRDGEKRGHVIQPRPDIRQRGFNGLPAREYR